MERYSVNRSVNLKPYTVNYYYVGDNTSKDFVAPNRLGWTTICLLDDGRNIHKQDFSLPQDMLPQHKISKIRDIENIII
jgi:putative hydrolase of the HAD superfamily